MRGVFASVSVCMNVSVRLSVCMCFCAFMCYLVLLTSLDASPALSPYWSLSPYLYPSRSLPLPPSFSPFPSLSRSFYVAIPIGFVIAIVIAIALDPSLGGVLVVFARRVLLLVCAFLFMSLDVEVVMYVARVLALGLCMALELYL